MSEIIEQKIIKADFFQKLIIKLNAPSLAVKTNFFRLLALAENAGLGIREALISKEIRDQQMTFDYYR